MITSHDFDNTNINDLQRYSFYLMNNVQTIILFVLRFTIELKRYMNQKKKLVFGSIYLILLLLGGSFTGFSQNNLLLSGKVTDLFQPKIVVKGRIMDLATSHPLENACIHNMSTGTMAFSDKNGDFALLAKKNDTLVFSRMGYHLEMLILSDSLLSAKERLSVWLVVHAIMLPSVTIYAMKPYPLFINEIAKEIPTKKIDVPGIEIPPEERANYDINNGNLLRGTPLASPISALYDLFSRKAKMERVYADLVQNQSEVMRLSKKYNSEIVQRLTKLEGEQLEEFMVYCSFTYYTLVISSDQEIEQMIFAKFIQYKRENGDSR